LDDAFERARMGTSHSVTTFPAMSGRDLLAVLRRKPLEYQVVRQKGSHRRLSAPGYPDLTFAFHDSASIAPGLVRKILIFDIGLDEEEAHRILKG
jgi:predicted RNA binding protein YcfA (HicA-like mRNA interferase family)